ncbi:hypothetical protein INS49_013689 [Diaporthe citri]|uniref:uncharacterized protein n=1 Tax=Diaporthe citri TaxID=83186 RepID=UPI001C7F3B0A|nr:uncharacterized protein INS49_013689 [Diaporthe citri]KAG6357810.1 hypothetical protein INS49_013689 [Diaporthe citri]
MVKIRGKAWTLTAVALLTILFYHNLLRIYYVSKINDLRKHAPPLSRKEAEEAGFAYVFYATSIPYACSALVNIHQLRNLGSTVPIHVLASEKVSKAYIDAFASAGVTTHVEMTPKLPLQHGHYYEDCLLKLVVFKMHTLDPSLKRVILFDSDQLILKHFDNLFSDIPPVDLAAPRAYWLPTEEAVFSSAFMLINLSDRLWDKVNKTLPTGDDDFGGAEPKVDMDILNDVLGDTATVLSGEYVTLNSHWEAWDLPNWYHPEDRQNSSHIQSDNPVKKPKRLRRPTEPMTHSRIDDQTSLATSEDSNIYNHLEELYEYTPIIHFTALGKPWMYTEEEVVQQRQDAHPAFALQFRQWKKVAEQ